VNLPGARWLQLNTQEGAITIVPKNIPCVQVLTPEFPPTNLVGNAFAPLPKCGPGFLDAIPRLAANFRQRMPSARKVNLPWHTASIPVPPISTSAKCPEAATRRIGGRYEKN
jgi:hypothetical protein